MTLSLDASALYQRVRTYERRSPEARLEAAREVMRPLLKEIIALTPVDTGRLQRGYAMATNAAGLGPVLVPPVGPSKYHDFAEIVLDRQVKFFAAIVQELEGIVADDGGTFRGKRITRYSAERRLETARKRLMRSQEERAKLTDTSVVIGLWEQSGTKTGGKVGTTVRATIYGGTGKAIATEFFSGFQVHNLEPHASIVEKNMGTVKAALAGAKSFRIRKVGKKYLATIEPAAGGMAAAG